MMSAETQAKLAEWQARQPAFIGKVTAQQLPGKAARQAQKRAAVRKASRI